ncbi:hypothetical protein R5R35_010363 [Gryllus longicercus]|uniref:Uncharacterized protein n=1 Tax=Gryllus longicercus TaxID=2509291 RepID=A0AAN9W0C7_9ORTH
MVTTSTTTAAPAPHSEEHQTRLLAASELACWRRIAEERAAQPASQLNAGASCPPLWDGILCWGRALPGQLLTQHCPAYVAGFHAQANASKLCTEDGQWFSRHANRSWTNYTQCFSGPQATVFIDMAASADDEAHVEPYLRALKTISEIGYSVSLASLLVALVILLSIKKLRCPRNVLHMHLFASFIMRAFMSLLKDSLFVQGLGMTADLLTREEGDYFHSEHQINWPCRTIICLWQYFIMANYSLILMEGLYLHNLIFLALFSDSSSITMYIVLGWGLPTLFVLPWAGCRALLENTWCWTTNDNITVFLLIRVPTIASVVVNFVLFINIVRVLLLKLKSSVCEETKTYRRWAKSTLVLVPLFGVHYMVFLGLHLSTNKTVEVVWLFCDQLFASFNGFFVALLYCFLNGEVRSELSKKWKHFSFAELLESWHCLRRDHMANGILSGGGRFLSKPRHSHPRGSCYSSTSFTTVSVLPSAHCCSLNKKRQSPAQAVRPAPAAAATAPATALPKSPGDDSCRAGLVEDAEEDRDSAHKVKEINNCGQNRRWSGTDYSSETNAVELKSITSSKNYIVNM